ncbi:MAG: hypothetical protein U0792_18820 [Gemmataceae bacterium]
MSTLDFVPLLLALGMLPVMVLLMVAGERVARRFREAPSGPVDAAVLALLGLLLGFQFAGASSRLDARRQIVLREANAIGTAYLRVDILPAEEQPQLRALFKEYTGLRIQMANARTIEEAVVADAQSRKVQGKIWSHAVAACRKDPSPATKTLVISAINDMIDVTSERMVASHTHTPKAVIALLLGVTLMSAFIVGYATEGPPRPWVHRILFMLVIVTTLYVTLDMEFPRAGLIQVGAADEALTATLAGMD